MLPGRTESSTSIYRCCDVAAIGPSSAATTLSAHTATFFHNLHVMHGCVATNDIVNHGVKGCEPEGVPCGVGVASGGPKGMPRTAGKSLNGTVSQNLEIKETI